MHDAALPLLQNSDPVYDVNLQCTNKNKTYNSFELVLSLHLIVKGVLLYFGSLITSNWGASLISAFDFPWRYISGFWLRTFLLLFVS